MQQPKIPPLIWFILGILLLLCSMTVAIAIHNPSGRSYPKMIQSPPEPVDYDKITEIIKQQIALLPMPKDGLNGAKGDKGDSVKGANGRDATPQQIAAAVSAYLGVNPPPQGEPGIVGKSFEYRCVQSAHRMDIRVIGETQWQIWFFIGADATCAVQ